MSIKVFSFKRAYLKFLGFIFAIAFFILAVSLLKGDSPNLIVSDASGYYAWIRSLIIDGDINFENDFQELYFPDPPSPDILKKTPNGLVHNRYPIGVAIVETPGFLLGHFLAKVTPFEADGISLPYQISVILSLVLLILFSFYLLGIALINYGINEKVAFFFAAMPLIGTNLLHYLAKEPAMAHGIGVALINILIFFSTRKNKIKRTSFYKIFLIGLLLGLLVISRNTNVILIPFFIFLFWEKLQTKENIIAFIAGIVLMLFLQELSLFLLWGKPVLNSYGNEGFTGEYMGITKAIFGEDYGVFLYHPYYLILVIINLFGLVKIKSLRFCNLMIIVSFIALWLINGIWGFRGDSFGHRAFVEILSPLSFGAAITVQKMSNQVTRYVQLPGIILMGILIILNFYLWGGYLLKKYPHNNSRTLYEAYTWIIRAKN